MSTATAKKTNIYPWVVVGLLSVVAFLNYLDRQMLATMQGAIGKDIVEISEKHHLEQMSPELMQITRRDTTTQKDTTYVISAQELADSPAPAIMGEAVYSKTQEEQAKARAAEAFGALMAIFLWIYALISPFAGSVADRLSRKWLIVGSLGVWSLVTLLMGFCTSYTQIYWLRGLMGISEALYIPSSLSLIADYHEGKSRSLAIGLHMAGLYLGQAVGGFGAIFSDALSWRLVFQGFGLIGVAYAVVLMLVLKEIRRPAVSCHAGRSGESVKKESILKSFGLIFSNIAFWAILFFFASTSLPGWGTKNWLPTLFEGSIDNKMWAGPIATITIALSSFIGVMFGGPLSDRWVKKNLKGRIYTSAIGLSLMIPALLLMGLGHGMVAAIVSGLVFGLGYGMFDTNNMPILCQFVPARLRATAYGFMNMVGVAMGALVTTLLGHFSNNLGLCFAILGGVTFLALAVQLLVLHPTTDNME
ncbi:MAG: MFS transporter [Bacteroidales bacterium]|nr:MFS transporter [Bacteroidales bacterium]